MSRVLYGGQPFSGVTYNQGAFSGDKGHLFIRGEQQCSYGLSLMSKSRIYCKIATIAKLQDVIQTGNVCEQCAKNVQILIDEYQKKEK
jgi:hypothetical protein